MKNGLKLGEVLQGDAAGEPLEFSLDLLRTGRLLLQASSGAGKSETLRKIIALTIPQIPNWIVDPEGEYAPLRAQMPFLLVGPGGEAPATLDTVDEVVRLLLETGVSAIFDLFELGMRKYEYAAKLFTALDEAPRKLWRDLLVTVDEAHALAPKDKQVQRASSLPFANLASRGRKRGIAIIVATQRLAELDNDVAALCENILFGRTGLLDQKRTATMLGYTGAEAREFTKQIGRVSDGDFFAYGRAFGRLDPTLFHVERVPGPTLTRANRGKQRTAPPTPESILHLLPRFEALPEEVHAKAQTEKDLRKELAEALKKIGTLERAAARPAVVSPAVCRPAMPAIDKEKLRMLTKKLEALSGGLAEAIRLSDEREQKDARIRQLLDELAKLLGPTPALGRALKRSQEAQTEAAAIVPALTTEAPMPIESVNSAWTPVKIQVPPAAPASTGTGQLGGKTGVLAGIAAGYGDAGISKKLLAALAGMTLGGSFGARLSEARTSGAIRTEGAMVYATPEGIATYGGSFQAPSNTEEVVALWSGRLGGKALEIFQHLVSLAGEPAKRSEIAEAVGMTIGGTFGARLSEVRSTGLLVEKGSTVAVDRELLFL